MPGINAEVFGGLGSIAAISLEHFANVALLELLLGFGERGDGQGSRTSVRVEVLGGDEGALGEHHGLLHPVLESDVARPGVFADGDDWPPG